MKKIKIYVYLLSVFSFYVYPQVFSPNDYCLIWADEFNVDGAPNPANWGYETGCSIRNSEAQNYTNSRKNSRVENGKLIIEALKENVGGCSYTSASLKSQGKVEFQFGRLDVRAKIDTRNGSWPAIWMLGVNGEWPSNGEIDVMEFYNSRIHANVAWGTETRWSGKWDSQNKLVSELGRAWADSFHVWRIEWTDKFINLYVDDLLMNTTDVTQTINGSISNMKNPFLQKQYILLNQAIGGNNGGDPSGTAFPIRYEVDYVRLYQKGSCKLDCNWQPNGTANLDNCLRCVNGNTSLKPCVLNCEGNILKTNAGFELNNLNDWAGWGTRAVTNTAFSGRYGVQVDNGSVERVVTVEPFMKYTFKVKAKKTGAGWFRLGSKDHGVTESFSEYANTAWTEATHTFTTGNTTTVRLYFYNGGGGSSNGDDFVLQPSGCLVTAIEDEEEKEEVNIYPNPSSNSFKLETNEIGTIQIYSLSGLLLEEHLLNPSQQYGTNLEISTYVVKIITPIRTKIFKWIKN